MITLYHNQDIKKAFEILLKNEITPSYFCQNGSDIEITIAFSASMCETLVLKNATIDKIKVDDMYSATYNAVIRNGNLYEITGQAVVLDSDENVNELDFSLLFEDAEIKIETSSALKADMVDSPWKYLQNIADEIIKKYYFLG